MIIQLFSAPNLYGKNIKWEGAIGYSSFSLRTSESKSIGFSGTSLKVGAHFHKKKKFYLGGFIEYRDLTNSYQNSVGGQEFLTAGSIGGTAGIFLDRAGQFFLELEPLVSVVYLDQIASLTEKHHTYNGAGIRLGSGYVYQAKSISFQAGPFIEIMSLTGGKDTDYNIEVEDVIAQGLTIYLGGAYYM